MISELNHHWKDYATPRLREALEKAADRSDLPIPMILKEIEHLRREWAPHAVFESVQNELDALADTFLLDLGEVDPFAWQCVHAALRDVGNDVSYWACEMWQQKEKITPEELETLNKQIREDELFDSREQYLTHKIDVLQLRKERLQKQLKILAEERGKVTLTKEEQELKKDQRRVRDIFFHWQDPFWSFIRNFQWRLGNLTPEARRELMEEVEEALKALQHMVEERTKPLYSNLKKLESGRRMDQEEERDEK